MEITKNIFGKVLKEIKIEDIIDFFKNEQEETSVLEFKSGETSLESIYSEVSAFLNTNGGILIVGSPRPFRKKDLDYCTGELMPSKNILSKRRLLQNIASHVVPSPIGIEIQELDYKKGKVFVLEIPQSNYPPHQNSKDGVYYVRLETMTIPASHGFMQALFNKRTNPDIYSDVVPYIKENNKILRFTFSNRSNISAIKAGGLIDIIGIKSLIYEDEKTVQSYGNITNIIHGTDKVRKSIDKFGFTFQCSLGTIIKGLLTPIELQLQTFKTNYLLTISTYADNCELKSNSYVVNPQNEEFTRMEDDFDMNKVLNDYQIAHDPLVNYRVVKQEYDKENK